MPGYPKAIWEYLCSRTLGRRPWAYLLTDTEGHILEWGGDLPEPHAVRKGVPITDIFDFMHGILPLETEALLLPNLRMQSKIAMDVHVFQTQGGYGLILVDAQAEGDTGALLQQTANLMALQHIRQSSKTVFKRPENRDGLPTDVIQTAEGERELNIARINVTVLSVDIQGIGPRLASASGLQLSATLLPYLSALAEAVFDHHGYMETWLGDRLTAVFGVSLEGEANTTASEALSSALRIMEACRALPTAEHIGAPPLFCRMGLASGKALIGYTRLKKRRMFHCHGDCFKIAQQLERSAAEGRLLMDESTYRRAAQGNPSFVPLRQRPDGIPSSLVIYQWEPKK